MNLSLFQRIILLLGTIVSLYFFVNPIRRSGVDSLTSLLTTQGIIGTLTLIALLLRSIVTTIDERIERSQRGYYTD